MYQDKAELMRLSQLMQSGCFGLGMQTEGLPNLSRVVVLGELIAPFVAGKEQ